MIQAAPQVTVLTPTFNRRDYLAQAIRSVLAQQFADWEMVVINDGGCDVRDVVEACGDERVAYVSQPENRGKAACLNLGLQRARGRYVAYLDDDDVWYPNHLATLVRALEANPQVGVAYSDLYAVVFLKGKDGRRYPLEKRVCVCRDYNRMLMFHFNHTLHVSLMHRKDLALRAGGYDENVRVMIDWDLTRKLSFYTDFLHVEETTGEYYQPVRDSDRISDVQRRDAESYRQNLRRIRADLPPEPWPMVQKVAVIFPVSRWDAQARATAEYLVDQLDYPCRIVLVNRDATGSEAACRAALGPLAELGNLRIQHAPGATLDEAYVAGARGERADLYYLPSDRLCREVGLRLITGLCYLEEARADAVRWQADPDAGSSYDVLVKRHALFPDGKPICPWPESARGATVPVVPDGWLPEALKADELLTFANRCENEGNYAAALRLLDEAAALKAGGAGRPYLVQLYANVAFGLGDHEKAEAMCRALISQGYGADNWVRLGRIHQSQGRYAEALEAYRRGLAGIGLAEADLDDGPFPFVCAADFDAFHAVAGRGECMVELGPADGVAQALRRASRLRANSPRPYVAFGRLFLQRGDWQSAAEAFALAGRRRRPPQDVAVEAGLAEAWEGMGRPGEAFQWLLKALSRRPDDVELLAKAARLGGLLGRAGETEALYRTFLSYRPGHVPALLGLAGICAAQGRAQEAAELTEQAEVLCALGGARVAAQGSGAARPAAKEPA